MNKSWSQAKQDGFRAILFDYLFSPITLNNSSVFPTGENPGSLPPILTHFISSTVTTKVDPYNNNITNSQSN